MFSSMATKFQMTFRKASWFFSWIAKLGDSWLFMPCSSILCLLSNLALFSGWTAWQKLQAVPGYPKFPASVEVHAQENSVMASPRCLAIFQHICKYDETNILFFSTMASRQHPQKYWNMLVRWASNPWVVGCLYSKTTSRNHRQMTVDTVTQLEVHAGTSAHLIRSHSIHQDRWSFLTYSVP